MLLRLFCQVYCYEETLAKEVRSLEVFRVEKQEKQKTIVSVDSKEENSTSEPTSPNPVINNIIPEKTIEEPKIENPTIVNKPIETPSMVTDDELKFDIPKVQSNNNLNYNEKIYAEPINIQNNIPKEPEVKPDYSSEYEKYNQELKKSQQSGIYNEPKNNEKFVVDDQFFDDFFDDGE